MNLMPVEEQQPALRGSYAKGVARRQEILDRAIEVFARRGSDRTSLRAIAEEVGVTHAALKHYFGSLEELLVAVYRESEARGDDREPTPLDVTPTELLRRWSDANHEVQGLVQLYSTLVASALEEGHPAAREFATERFARVRAELAARVRHNQATGRIRADVDPVAVAALVIAASDGLQTQWLLDADAPQDAALALLDQLLAGPAD
ncbi:helix-turn-helix domain-containing protein [Microbacterium sp. M3]|jgi:AcrR family transcriptional regulator|uniref:Helix-turn-helix domain-containing protein n=2 Tax=Microbacteriaceae TaxID=85023 RepID=A0ABU4H307_9MICO|nr:helix-turn-helix domain-containing protein [Microbacterium arthrosphaerae]MDW7607569.1 helix-turn-helix domain-containing protein [Microbacterium sp. M3]